MRKYVAIVELPDDYLEPGTTEDDELHAFERDSLLFGEFIEAARKDSRARVTFEVRDVKDKD